MPKPRRKLLTRPGCPAWMVTYGDMMGLLLCVFVAIVSISELRPDSKWARFANSLKAAFHGSDARAAVMAQPSAPQTLLAQLEAVAFNATESDGAANNIPPAGGLRIVDTPEGVRLELSGELAFAEGESNLPTAGVETLRQIASQAAGRSIAVYITARAAAHPADDPWALSHARARSAAEAFIAGGVHAEQIRLIAAELAAPGPVLEVLFTTANASSAASPPIDRNGEDRTHG